MEKQGTLLYHLAAFFTIIVWGTTMVFTKVLLHEGLSPEEIMIIRFVMAYICLWVVGIVASLSAIFFGPYPSAISE